MNEQLEKLKKKFTKLLKKMGIKIKKAPTVMTTMSNTYEISLVPEIKLQMIKIMRLRNLMLFIGIVVAAAAGGTVAILASVAGGQNVAIANQDAKLNQLSNLIKSYTNLDDLLTIQSQLNGLSQLEQNKKMLSRVFSFMTAVQPDMATDKVKINEMNLALDSNTIMIDGLANAMVEPYIDYRALESYKKGMSLTKYDYGRYVDENGDEIPTYCMVEIDENGATLEENKKGVYAYWLRGLIGCDPARDDFESNTEEDDGMSSVMSYGASEILKDLGETNEKREEREEQENKYNDRIAEYTDYEKKLAAMQLEKSGVQMSNVEVVKVWRTPQFDEWYNAKREGTKEPASITLDGVITNVPHFESKCITYSGTEQGKNVLWAADNDCMFLTEDMTILRSSNGKDPSVKDQNAADKLVLSFSATIKVNKEIFKSTNRHMMAIGPTGQNVTDSYRQIEGMFGDKALECNVNGVICTSSEMKNNSGATWETDDADEFDREGE